VDVEKCAYYVNKLCQSVGLETGKWRQIVTSQTAHTKYKWPPCDPEPKTPWKFSAYATENIGQLTKVRTPRRLKNWADKLRKLITENIPLHWVLSENSELNQIKTYSNKSAYMAHAVTFAAIRTTKTREHFAESSYTFAIASTDNAQHKNCLSSGSDDRLGRNMFRVLKRSPISQPHTLGLRRGYSDRKAVGKHDRTPTKIASEKENFPATLIMTSAWPDWSKFQFLRA